MLLPSLALDLPTPGGPPKGPPRAPSAIGCVRVRTDDAEAAESCVAAIRRLGVNRVEVALAQAFPSGFRLAHHPSLKGTRCLSSLRAVLGLARRDADPSGACALNVYRLASGEPPDTVEVDLPIQAAREGRLVRDLLADIGAYTIHLAGAARPEEAGAQLARALAACGGRADVRGGRGHAPGLPRVIVGAAPLEVGQHIARLLQRWTGVSLEVRRAFDEHATDVWVVLPDGTHLSASPGEALASGARRRDERPFLELTAGAVRVGNRTLARRAAPHPLAPSLSAFAHTCLDTPTAELLDHLATSVSLREPVLLEGPTAAGKTASVLLLAALLGQPVVRINLSGHTDTGELIGRYAPSERGWRWQEGLLPRAMREGWWVLLDELNLAEPAVAERLNPVLERAPTLVLTEGDGLRLGAGGEPIAPDFRVFATMNPPDGAYRGRNALSPALRDRFVAQRTCRLPDEAEHRALLEQLVFDRPPAVRVRGVAWAGARVAAPSGYGVLRDVPEIDRYLGALARCHASMDAAARAEDPRQRLGGGRAEGVTFSRRTLLAVLDFWVAHRGADEPWAEVVAASVDRYYRARAASPDDLAAIDALARAAGLPTVGALEPEALR